MKKHLGLFVLTAAISLPSFAQGFYTFADYTHNKLEGSADGDSASESDSGYNLGLGYKINNTISVELAYRDIYKKTIHESNSDYSFTGKSTVTAIQLSALAFYPLNDKFSFFGRLGYGQLKSKYSYTGQGWGETDSGSGSQSYNRALLGVGTHLSLNEHWGMRLEYDRFAKIEGTSVSSVNLGVEFHF